MKIPDVNVLVHLHRDGHAHHHVAHEWWRETRRVGEPLTVPDVVWVGFIRVVTSSRIFPDASSPSEAWSFIESVRAHGIYLEYSANPKLLTIFGDQLLDATATGNLVTDTYIAAIALSLGATVVTFDRDFRRFDGLKVLELA